MKHNLMIFIFFLMFILQSGFAQKERWNWCFERNNGISFNNKDTIPTPFEGTMLNLPDNSMGGDHYFMDYSNISNSNGELVLYTGGSKYYDGTNNYFYPVWNKYNTMVENSSYNFASLGQFFSLLAPYPGKSNLYYHIKGSLQFGTQTFPLLFDIIDINANNNNGKVINKDIVIHGGLDFATTGLALIKHSNNINYWIVNFGYVWASSQVRLTRPIYRNYLLSGNKVIDSVEITPRITPDFQSRLVVSPNGKLLTNTEERYIRTDSSGEIGFNVFDVYLELSNFNSNNGNMTSKVIKICDSCIVIDLEFSPDSKKFYTLEHHISQTNQFRRYTRKLFQFTIDTDVSKIEKSKKKVAPDISDLVFYGHASPIPPDPDGNPGLYEAIRLAPNNKIYILRKDTNFLSSLDNVNSEAGNVIFTNKTVDLGKNKGIGQFPVFLHDYYNVNLTISGQTIVCESESINLNADISDTLYKRSFVWKGPNQFTSNSKNPIIQNAQLSDEGWYILKATVNGAELWDSVYVKVNPQKHPEVFGVKFSLEYATYSYYTSNPTKRTNKWSVRRGEFIGDSTSDTVSIKWGDDGTGILILEQTKSDSECSGYTELLVEINNWPPVSILGEADVCENDTTVYKALAHSNIQNKWFVSNGIIVNEKLDELTVYWNKAGQGIVKVIRENFLTQSIDSNEISITINSKPDKPIINEKGNNILETQNSYFYQWFLNGTLIAGESKNYIKVKESGIYQVMIIDSNGCQSDISDPLNLLVAVDWNVQIENNFDISPNPATNFIEISVGARLAVSEQSDVKIYNVLGEIQTTPSLRDTPPWKGGEIVKIDVSILSPGMYFVRLGDKVSKFIKI